MGEFARVHDPDALRNFRSAILAYGEKVTGSLGEAEAELQRVSMWLENEQTSYWQSQLRSRHAALMKAKEDLRFKQLFKSATGARQSTVEEEKAVAMAMRRYAEAEQKTAAVKKWIRQLHHESHLYRGSVQRLATTASTNVPQAAAKIARMLASLEKYFALKAPDLGPAAQSSGAGAMGWSEQVGLATATKDLRHRTPPGEIKDKAQPASVSEWTSGAVPGPDEDRIKLLATGHDAPDGASIVVVGVGAATAGRVYLERSAPAFPGDSGWYIGPADQTHAAGYVTTTVGGLLQATPHFANLLKLPVGDLIVIDSAGVSVVLDVNDIDVWAS